MSWDAMFGAVKEELPKFNDYLLRDFRKEQIDKCIEFMHVVYQEAVKLFNGSLQYLGYRILSPERRINYSVENILIKGRVNIQASELQLVEYMFQFEDQLFPVYIYLPYLSNGAITINDTRYYLQLPIIERTIYRVTDGVIIKVLRSPLQFWRTEQYSYMSTNGQSFFDAIITTKVHYKKGKSNTARNTRTPLLLYLLSQYDFIYLQKNIFGLSTDDVQFTSENYANDEEYLFFKCRDGIYLRVHKDNVMSDITFRRYIASLLYIISGVKRYSIADLYNQTFYRTLLGKNLYGQATKEGLAAGHAESDLNSLRTYLDQYTKHELELLHIYCNDIFDLFVVVFFNIDNWLLEYSPNNLFAKRIGGIDLILMGMVKATFTRFYDTLRKNKIITAKNIRSMLKMDPMTISGLYKIPSLQPNSSLYNDNVLLSTLVKKVRLTSTQENRKKKTNLITAKEHQFHPSFLAIESALAISSSSPGVSGDINPFAQIDTMGYFQEDKMPWYDEILPLSKYLVSV